MKISFTNVNISITEGKISATQVKCISKKGFTVRARA
jgi:hypothetical protein